MLEAMQPRGGDASASVTHLATTAGTGIAPSCYIATDRCHPWLALGYLVATEMYDTPDKQQVVSDARELRRSSPVGVDPRAN